MSAGYRFTPGSTPVLVSCPHAGTDVPADILARFSAAGRALPDTDWHVDRLYDFAPELGAGLLVATASRYVVDLNRDPSGRPLYPGADNTALCPTRTFADEPIYRPGVEFGEQETGARVERYWQPYHDKLRAELDALRARHGVAVLIEGHSIRSEVPRFFAGRLPDLNFGTAKGASADEDLAARLHAVLAAAPGYTSVRDGRFTGGYITRTCGRPADGIHAVQLEKAQITYMDEAPPFAYRPELADRLKPTLRRLLTAALEWAAVCR